MTADVHAVSNRLAERGVPEGDTRHVMLALVQLWALTWTVRPAFDDVIVADEAGPRVPSAEARPETEASGHSLAPELESMIRAVVDFSRTSESVPDDAVGVGSPWRTVRDDIASGSGNGYRAVIGQDLLRAFGARRAASGAPVPTRPDLGPPQRPSDAERDALIARMAVTWQQTLDDLADR